ncbi:hypothetical protein ACQEUU_05345 [Nonomuraea sp. CA-218870]|uniref:hypothetical protein n=1 Tax=Nonomuraea sp. CA-218870 TaxID=3239998 RepID=UPI003D8F78AE
MLRKRIGPVLAAASLAAAGVLVLEAPAQAASSHAIVKTGGTRAGEVWFNRADGSHGNNAWFDLYDAKCDAEPVYVYWKYVTDGLSKWNTNSNDGGCNTTAGFNLKSGSFTIEYKVCVDDGVFSDTCSGTVRDRN